MCLVLLELESLPFLANSIVDLLSWKIMLRLMLYPWPMLKALDQLPWLPRLKPCWLLWLLVRIVMTAILLLEGSLHGQFGIVLLGGITQLSIHGGIELAVANVQILERLIGLNGGTKGLLVWVIMPFQYPSRTESTPVILNADWILEFC